MMRPSTTVRYLGVFLDDPTDVLAEVVDYLAEPRAGEAIEGVSVGNPNAPTAENQPNNLARSDNGQNIACTARSIEHRHRYVSSVLDSYVLGTLGVRGLQAS